MKRQIRKASKKANIGYVNIVSWTLLGINLRTKSFVRLSLPPVQFKYVNNLFNTAQDVLLLY
jgi:hypothetical protein